jgi:hypothetical protein
MHNLMLSNPRLARQSAGVLGSWGGKLAAQTEAARRAAKEVGSGQFLDVTTNHPRRSMLRPLDSASEERERRLLSPLCPGTPISTLGNNLNLTSPLSDVREALH